MDQHEQTHSTTIINENSIETYRLILENTTECIWSYDCTNQRIKYISPSIQKLRGLSLEEAMNESLEDRFTKDSLRQILKCSRLAKFMAGYRSEETVSDIDEFEQYCKDGSIKTVEISSRLVFDKHSNIICLIGVSRDVSHRKLGSLQLLEQDEKEPIPHSDERVYKLRVYFFDKFAVYVGSSGQIKWRTRKTEELFAYFLQNENRKMFRDEICDTLWPNTSTDKSIVYLHTTIYKMKKDLEARGIKIKVDFADGYYSYELPPYYSDTREFTKIYNPLSLLIGKIDEKSAMNCEKLISIYKGDYLSRNGYVWALTESALYREQLESALLDLSKYYISMRNFKAARKLLLELINIDKLNETFYEVLFTVFLHEKDYPSFNKYYNSLKKSLRLELGVEPSSGIQNLYKYMLTQRFG